MAKFITKEDKKRERYELDARINRLLKITEEEVSRVIQSPRASYHNGNFSFWIRYLGLPITVSASENEIIIQEEEAIDLAIRLDLLYRKYSEPEFTIFKDYTEKRKQEVSQLEAQIEPN